MVDRHIVVLDAGTSRPRCHLFDADGNVASVVEARWEYAHEDGSAALAKAFDPAMTWAGLAGTVRECVDRSAVDASRIEAVAVTGQRQAVAFLDGSGRELYVGPSLDLRGVFEGGAIDEDFASEVYSVTGHLPSMFFTAAKLRWFQVHRPEAYARIASVVTLADWLVWHLTGELSSEASLAGEAGLLDVSRRHWCTGLMERLGLEAHSVPLIEAGTIAGRLRNGAARGTGLLPGTPIVAAGADTQCGLLGLGISQPDEAGVVAGWSSPVQMVLGEPRMPGNGTTWTGCFLENGRWVLESNPGDTGNAYRWLVSTFGNGGFEDMDALARELPAGSGGVMAFLGHKRMDMARVGMRQGGFVFPVPFTLDPPGVGHLARAAIESVAFSIKANLEQLESLAGPANGAIGVGGGMTRTETFVKVLADVLDRDILVSSMADVTALGACMCARKALGEFSTLSDAAAAATSFGRTVAPEPGVASEYADHYEHWAHAMSRLEDIQL